MPGINRKILEEGKKSGFAAVEGFAQKVKKQEYVSVPDEEALLHSSQSDRVSVRAFWETGDPVGFSISNPNLQSIKEAFSTIYSAHLPNRDNVDNFRHLLPASVEKIKLAIYDETVESVDVGAFNHLMDRIDEILTTPAFQELKIRKILLSKILKKTYVTNSNGLNAKYIKSLFNLQLNLGLGANRIDVNQSRIFFQQLEPLRLISRGLNLLYSLTENPIKVPAGKDIFLILAPEVSAFILKEFSHYLKVKVDKEMMKIRYPAILNIVDDPLMDGQAGSVPFDDEGVQIRSGATFLVRKGVFSRVISDLNSAFHGQTPATGNGFRNHRGPFPVARFSNLYIKPTVLPLKNLRDSAVNGVVVSLVKLKTIDSRGYLFSAYGYRFQNGEMQEPVHFHLRTSFRSYLLNILKVSSEIKFFHSAFSIGSPYVLVKAGSKSDNILDI
jgi:predicted Zn-dependent protease